jgi:hypothetical protein
VVEHSLGKGEVDSSILSGSTSQQDRSLRDPSIGNAQSALANPLVRFPQRLIGAAKLRLLSDLIRVHLSTKNRYQPMG